MADTKIIKLRRPVSLGKEGEEIVFDTLNLREPLAREIEESAGSNAALIAIVSAIPRKAAEQLSARDYMEAVTYINSFLIVSPETGES